MNNPGQTTPNSNHIKHATAVAGTVFAATQVVDAAEKGVRDFSVHSRKLRVGLVGCGGRGTGAAHDCVSAAPDIEIYALGDMFPEKITAFHKNVKALGDKVNLSDTRCFTGFDAYLKVIQSGVDIVLLATPPGFRPLHMRAAIEAGKHVFAEKPVAVDPPGVRSVIETAQLAAKKNIGILAGTQYRHDPRYVELVTRLHAGDIGDILAVQCYYCSSGVGSPSKRKPEWSDMEYQIRNWYYYTWLSGDHIVEQHVHNLDVMNWALQAHPDKCLSLGGRQVRIGPDFGNIYDHFTTLYEYPNGIKVQSMCRHWENTAGRLGDRFVGTRGVATAHGIWKPWPEIEGEKPWKYNGPTVNPHMLEHRDFIASIRAGKPLNEGRQVAESSLTAIMARMSAYTGKEVTWEQALSSKLKFFPDKLEFGPHPVDPVAVPGKTPLI